MTSNPMAQVRIYEGAEATAEPMTVTGAVNRAMLLMLLAVGVAVYTWELMFKGFMDKAMMLMWVGIIAGFVLAIITSFKPKVAKLTSIAYAICEGLVVGVVSAMYQSVYDGIVIKAAGLTFLSLFSMLALYKLNIIRATDKFRKTIFTATLAIAIFYLIAIVGSFFGANMLSVFNGGALGIGISVIICAIASLNFILDFDFIERGAETLAPKYFEWFGAFSLLVTVVWLYFEMLRLLAQLNKK